ncbi:MAG: corrinoid protein [Ardenticatenaceae bacterium]|nr:corrinoid protein [Ardenticatenaceae bacterium]
MSDKQELLEVVIDAIVDGDDEAAPTAVQNALDAGFTALTVLDALMEGADEVGQLFESGEFFLPELMLTGRALKAAMAVLTPVLQTEQAADETAVKDTGTVIMATIQTDIHDIGKNMVSSMLTAAGFKVFDLGVDVPAKAIIAKAKEEKAHIIGCSGLLTTSMPYIKDMIDLMAVMGERNNFKVMVGGASVTPTWAAHIGADGTAPNPVEAVKLAKRLIQEQRKEKVQ